MVVNSTSILLKQQAVVHEKWLERNGSWASAEQKLPFHELSKSEADKDRVLVRKGIEIYEQRASVLVPNQARILHPSIEQVKNEIRKPGKKVVTFAGYSSAEYENKKEMLSQARAILSALDPKTTIINIGATPDGIGAVYEIAKDLGFETIGIVSEKGLTYGVSTFVDKVFFIQDSSWGGFIPGTNKLSPTSETIIEISDQFIAIGGGQIAAEEMSEALNAGRKVTFIAADMNHNKAITTAQSKGQPIPSDFRGLTQKAWEKVSH